jgi:membrane protease YdiL (CAAX protease family)
VDSRLERLRVDPAVRHVLDDRVIPVSTPAENLARTWSGRLATGLGVLMLAGMLPLAARRRAPLAAPALAAGGWSARWLTGAAATTVGGGAWLIAGLLLLGLEASPWFGPDVDHDALAQVLSGWWPFAALPALALLAGGMLMSLATVTASARSAALAVMGLAAVLLASLANIAGLRPHTLVDLVPITGPLVVLKTAAMNTPGIWRDLAITTAAHACYGAALAWLATRTRLTWSSTWEAVVLYAAAVAVFTTVSPLFTDQSDPIALCAPLALGVLGVAATHAFIRRQSPIASWSLRLPAWHWLLTAAFVAPALALAGLAVGDLQPALPAGMTTGAETLDDIATAHWSIALACLALAPAVCEELLFRGAILGLLKQRLPAIIAVLISALMFAALHGSPWRFLPQFVVGIALAVLTLRSGSVLPAILLHAIYNGLLWALDAHNAAVREVTWLQTLIDTPWLAATCGGICVAIAFWPRWSRQPTYLPTTAEAPEIS